MGCEKIDFPGGGFAILCSRRQRVKKCESLPGCLNDSTKLCDFPVANGKTCDRRICNDHATSIGTDKDCCPTHAKIVRWSKETPQTTVKIVGRVLYVHGNKSVKLWTPFGNGFVPKSLIRDSDPPKDRLEEGDEVTMEIPYWAARERGWA